MNTWNVKKNSGFSMIELMVVIVIVAILVALAYPSYLQYIRKSKRGEAQQLLMNWSINQEIWRSNNPKYADGTDLTPPNHDDYTFAVYQSDAAPGNVPTAGEYTLRATALNDQVNDKARDGSYCGKSGNELKLVQTGIKSPANCWD